MNTKWQKMLHLIYCLNLLVTFYATLRQEFEIRLNNFPICRAFSLQYSIIAWGEKIILAFGSLTKYYRVPRIWDSPTPSPASEWATHPKPKGGGHTRLWGSPNSEDWRKSLALCLLCGVSYILTNPRPTLQKSGDEVILLSAAQGAQQCTFLTS